MLTSIYKDIPSHLILKYYKNFIHGRWWRSWWNDSDDKDDLVEIKVVVVFVSEI